MAIITLVLSNQKIHIMADIRVEKKKPVWPWLFLIIILAVVIFLYFYGSTDSEEDEMEDEIEEVTTFKSDENSHQIKKIIV